DGHDGVVERRLDVGDAPAHIATGFAFLALGHRSNSRRRSRRGLRCALAYRARNASHLSLPTHFLDALLARHGLARALAGPGVGPRPLAAHRQAAAMAQAPVAANVA